MNDQFDSKPDQYLGNICVAQNVKGGLRNSPAITYPSLTSVGRLDLDDFAQNRLIGQLGSPSFNQRLLRFSPEQLSRVGLG